MGPATSTTRPDPNRIVSAGHIAATAMRRPHWKLLSHEQAWSASMQYSARTGDSRPLALSGTDYRPPPGAALPKGGGGSISPLLQVGPVPLTCAARETP